MDLEDEVPGLADPDECDDAADADSTVGLNAEDNDNDTPFNVDDISSLIRCLVFLCVKTCKMCCHSSNEENPLRAGPYKATRNLPCRPWFRGTVLAPKGLVCRLCEWAFYLGGFNLTYKNLDDLHDKMRSDDGGSLTDEWMAVIDSLIDMVNKGRITAKLRGSKRKIVMEKVAESRQRAVTLYQSEGTRAREKFRAICLQKYLKKFPGSDPKADGHIVRKTLVPQRGWIDCVLMRKLPVDEWDVEVDADVRAMLSETHVTSDTQLRAGQVDDTYKALVAGASSIASESKAMKALPASSSSPLEQLGQKTQADDQDEAKDDEGSDSDASDDESSEDDPLAGTLLGGLMGARQASTSKSKSGQNAKAAASSTSPAKGVGTKRPGSTTASPFAKKAKSSPAHSGRGSGQKRESLESIVESPAAKRGKGSSPKDQDGLGDAVPRKGKGKAARIPSDIFGLLAYEGYDVVEENVVKLMERIADNNGPFEAIGCDAKVFAAFAEAVKAICIEFDTHIKSLQNMDVKMSKRQGTPSEALQKVRDLKTFLRTYQSLLKEVAKRDGDLVKCQALLTSLEPTTMAHIPTGATFRVWKLSCMDLVRQRKFGELAIKLTIDASHPFKVDQARAFELNGTIVEVGFQRLVGLVAGLKEEADRSNIMKILDMCFAIINTDTATLTSTDSDDVKKFSEGLDCDEDSTVTYAEQDAAIKYLEEKKNDDTYFGVLKGAFQQPQFVNVLAFAKAKLAGKQASQGVGCESELLISILNKIKSKEYVAGSEGFNKIFVDLAQKILDEAKPKAGSIKLFTQVIDETLKVMEATDQHGAEFCGGFLNGLVASALAKARGQQAPMPSVANFEAMVKTQQEIGIHSPLAPPQIKAFAIRKCDIAQSVAKSRQMQRNAERLLNFAKTSMSIAENFSQASPDIAVLTQAFAKCDELIQEFPQHLKDSIKLAYNELQGVCSISNVCKPQYEAELLAMKIVLLNGFEAAILLDADAARGHLEGFTIKYTQCMKLARWMPSPEVERQKLTTLQAFVTLASNVELFAQLRDKAKHTAQVFETVHAACSTLSSSGAMRQVVLEGMIPKEKADAFVAWCDGFGKFINATAEENTILGDKQVKEKTAALLKVLEHFTKDSDNSVALKVKKVDDDLIAALTRAKACHAFHPGDEAAKKAAETVHEKASGLTVVWSVRTLLDIPHINDPKKGQGTRIKLRSIYESHMKDADEANVYWDNKMLAQVVAIVEKMKGTTTQEKPTASNPGAAASSTEPAPATAAQASMASTSAAAADAAESRAQASSASGSAAQGARRRARKTHP